MAELWQQTATRLGEELAERYCSKLPVDPFHIANQLDIAVEPLPSDRKTVSGTLVYVESENETIFGIQYATYIDSRGFQNFCVAHELGHFSIPNHPEKILINGIHESNAGFASGDRCEQEADHFAAGLLMPAFLFDPIIDKVQSGLKAIELLAGTCGTSLPATAIRYAQRSPDRVAIIVSEGCYVRYCFMSDEMKEMSGLSWIKKNSSLPRDTVTFSFNQSKDNILQAVRAEGAADFADWFSCNKPYELYEEVVGLGRYGRTLTVLTADEVLDEEELEDEEALVESWTPRFKR